MKISIIIPNYNGEKLLEKNLPKVFEAADYYIQKSNTDVEVIVIDDCSTDNSINEIQNAKLKSQNLKLKVKILINERNLGFSSTVNKGVKESTGEILVLLNTDVCPEKDFLIPLLSHFQDNQVFAVGCMDKSIEGSEIVLRGRGIGTWKRGFLMHKRGEVDQSTTLWVNGGSGAFRKSMWEKLGGFNELYSPFYWEDIDLSYRALKAGYTILFEPKSIVIHEHIKGAIKSKYSEQEIKKIAYRNQFIFIWKNITGKDLLIQHIAWLPYHFLKAMLRKDLIFFIGFFKALSKLNNILQYKIDGQKLFVKTDREVIQLFTI